MKVAALMFALGTVGMILASTTRKLVTLYTRSRSSTTAITLLELPMRAVPQGWYEVDVTACETQVK